MVSDAARRALQLFEEALELDADRRREYLEAACVGNDELRAEIDALLDSADDSVAILPDTVSRDTVTGDGVRSGLSRIEIGDVLSDRYSIVATLGSGGMGDVFRARDRRLGREVAIKTLNDSAAQSREMRERFDREMKSVAALSHPNIVTLFDLAEHGEVTYAVMELVEGETLCERRKRGLDWREATRLIRDIAQGLAAAHEHDMMHRDIKPQNVIVASDGRARVLDFGLARSKTPDPDQAITVGGLIPGTIPYMSPEQAEAGDLTCATDVFSLGTTAYELLCGINPFLDTGLLQTLQRISRAEVAALDSMVEELPAELSKVVMSMLARRASDRPTARAIAEELDLLISREVDSEPPLAPTREDTRVRPRGWQPSLVVLPFRVVGNHEEIAAIADGLAEELTTVLTRVPLLSLASRMTSLALADQPQSPSEVRERLRVDFMVEASVQRVGPIVRANVQLVETKSGTSLWAQRFESPETDDIVGVLLRRVLSRLEPQLVRATLEALRGDSGEPTSRELLLKAMGVLSLKGWHRDSFEEVAELIKRSIELEPDFALSHAYLALMRGLGQRVGLLTDRELAVREAVEHAEIALELESMDSNVLGLAGCAFADIGETTRAIPILKNAIDLNPHNAQAHAALGAAHLADEDYADAIQPLRTGIDLSPLDGRLAVWYAMLSLAYLQTGDIEKAEEAAQIGCQSDRKTYLPRLVLCAVYVVRKEAEKAQVALEESLRVKPDLSQHEIVHLVGPRLAAAVRRLMRQRDRVSD